MDSVLSPFLRVLRVSDHGVPCERLKMFLLSGVRTETWRPEFGNPRFQLPPPPDTTDKDTTTPEGPRFRSVGIMVVQ